MVALHGGGGKVKIGRQVCSRIGQAAPGDPTGYRPARSNASTGQPDRAVAAFRFNGGQHLLLFERADVHWRRWQVRVGPYSGVSWASGTN